MLHKSFHENNEILFIANEGIKSTKIKIHYVQKDENDVVNRSPIASIPSLLELFNAFAFAQREDNLLWYKKKLLSPGNINHKKKQIPWVQKNFMRKDIHDKQYETVGFPFDKVQLVEQCGCTSRPPFDVLYSARLCSGQKPPSK